MTSAAIVLRSCLALGLALLMAALPAVAAGDGGDIRLQGDSVELLISLQDGLPSYWLSCAGPCSDAGVPRQELVGRGGGVLQWSGTDTELLRAMNSGDYRASIRETAETLIVELLSEAGGSSGLVQRYELSRHGHVLDMQLAVLPGMSLEMASGRSFIPEQLPGFGAAFSDVNAVRVGHSGQEVISGEEPRALSAESDHWTGVRSRFWAWLVQPATDSDVAVETTERNQHRLVWQTADDALDLRFYGGPMEWDSLRPVSFDLTRMLFSGLWEPLRWLCIALLFLLAFIQSWVSSEGLAIILLSLAVKIILAPATYIADRWQAEVNRAQSRLQPRLAEIRRQYHGEEAHKRTLQAYKEEGVHPLYTFKSLAGFAIQVPMFIAAFDMLAENFALDAVGFLWMADLASPDRLSALPMVLPFFGGHLNLLPFLMTAISITSAVVQQEPTLNAALQARQRRNLYLMAFAFFLLFYTFPAGMVLYWTANNVWHLAKVLILRQFAPARD